MSGCSDAIRCSRSGISSPASTNTVSSAGLRMIVRHTVRTTFAAIPWPSGWSACGASASTSRANARECRVSSPISWSMYATRGSEMSPVSESCIEKPAMRTASKSTPVVSMDAVSSRDSCARCAESSSMSSPAMLSSSSAMTWPVPSDVQSKTSSGSITRRSDACDRRPTLSVRTSVASVRSVISIMVRGLPWSSEVARQHGPVESRSQVHLSIRHFGGRQRVTL